MPPHQSKLSYGILDTILNEKVIDALLKLLFYSHSRRDHDIFTSAKQCFAPGMHSSPALKGMGISAKIIREIEIHRQTTDPDVLSRKPAVSYVKQGNIYQSFGFPNALVDRAVSPSEPFQLTSSPLLADKFLIEGCSLEVNSDSVVVKKGPQVLRRYAISDIATNPIPFIESVTLPNGGQSGRVVQVFAEFALSERPLREEAKKKHPDDPRQQRTHVEMTVGPWKRWGRTRP